MMLPAVLAAAPSVRVEAGCLLVTATTSNITSIVLKGGSVLTAQSVFVGSISIIGGNLIIPVRTVVMITGQMLFTSGSIQGKDVFCMSSIIMS